MSPWGPTFQGTDSHQSPQRPGEHWVLKPQHGLEPESSVLWSQNGLSQCTAIYSMLICATLKQEDIVGQSIPLLNSFLKIIAGGRYRETDKGNAVFLGCIWSGVLSGVTHSLQPQENVLSISILEALLLSVRKQKEIPFNCVSPKWWAKFS